MSTISTDAAAEESPKLLTDVTVHEDDLSAEAKHRFPYHTKIRSAFERHRHNVQCDPDLTLLGRHRLFSSIDRLHSTSKEVLNYMAENHAHLDRQMPEIGPLVICGLPRTGTTLLYNLLACDSNCRAPLFTEMFVQAVPPVERSNLIEQKRRSDQENLIAQQNGQHASLFALYALVNSDDLTDPDAWFREATNKDFAYDYHKTFLRMLNSVDAPHSHWLLKSHWHNFYMETFLRHYPRALLLMTHRSLDEVFPSYCRLISGYGDYYFDPTNSQSRDKLTQRSIHLLDKMIERIVEFRTQPQTTKNMCEQNTIDIMYTDLIENPIATVHHIYDYFGLCWSDDFETAMGVWLRDHPQGKHGRNTYSLAQFGLSHMEIERRYSDYNKLFLRSRSSKVMAGNDS